MKFTYFCVKFERLNNENFPFSGVGVGLLKNCRRVTLARNIHSNIKNLSEQDVKHIQVILRNIS